MEIIQMVNKRFGRLTVIERDYSRKTNTYFICKCDCGNIKTCRADRLR